VRFTTTELARAVDGTHDGDDVNVDGVATDSRELDPGTLFVPIVARRDGHDFIDAARAAGAAAYLTMRTPRGGTAIVVDDTMHALARIGRYARTRLPDAVVGITGSVGKTTVKDLTAAVLARRGPVGAARHSFNNEIGVPVTLADAPGDAWAVVVEMGARGVGHIAELCSIARPTVGVVTSVAPAHTELFGSLDDVARAKAELVEALPVDGTAVLNADDARVANMAHRTDAHVLTFGECAGDVAACDVTLDALLRPSFSLCTPDSRVDCRLAISGAHMAINAAAAAAVGLALGVRVDDIVAALEDARVSPRRMDVTRTARGATLIDDAYNANPTSMAAALRALAALPTRGRRVAVLGVMAELGPDAGTYHADIASLADDLELELIAVAAPLYGATVAVDDVDHAIDALGPLGPDDAVLVKGSRVAALERLVDRLTSPPA
jgi:UDP-N-acetylmuramoyl-tripeptide--D-alanyl-D-alanine ligase